MAISIWIVVWFIALGVCVVGPTLLFERVPFFRRLLRQMAVRGVNSSGAETVNISKVSQKEEDSIRHAFVSALLTPFSMTVTSDMIIENPLDNVKEEMQDAPPADRHVDVEMGGGNGPIDNEINVEKKTDGCKDSADQELSTNASPVDETSTENGSELLVVHRDTSDDPHKDTGMDEESQDLHVDMDLDEECQGQVCHLPPAGCSNVASKDHERKVANCCAICLGTVETKESICWSSNPQCQHVFHSACALDWFQASGSKYLKQMRKTKASVPGDDFWKLNPVEQITSFPLSCPCCRQIFLIRPKDENETKSSNFEKFTLPQGNDNNESIPTI